NKFYGITQAGGPNFTGVPPGPGGAVFSVTSDGVFSNLYFFPATGGNGGISLTPGNGGNFYGTTGNNVFKLNPDGTMANSNLAAFPSHTPALGLVQDHDGTLYGTISDGGPSRSGTIYKIDTNGVFSTILTFNGTNGSNPSTLLLGL